MMSRYSANPERAMSTMSLDLTTAAPRQMLRWRQMKRSFAEWRRRAHSRWELTTLSDRELNDIGLSRCNVSSESCKPFWMA
jgi:uncharacterized protein YjiS (DUF1127 family)